MARQVKQLTPPKGCSRLLFRTPITLYRLGLGSLLGKRFLLLYHTGRKSGLQRQAVLEVVEHNPQTNEYVVTAGFGPKSDWYQNLLASPKVFIQVGRDKWPVIAEQLSPQESAEVIADFAKRYPGEAKMAPLLGYEVDGSEEDYRQIGEMMILIRFTPLSPE